ncbi:hypothetical protein TNCV_4725881 [Trichonephila clavipes]|nr:hypothetical protein TNCV_4725881 [Trichonephila clavipes]
MGKEELLTYKRRGAVVKSNITFTHAGTVQMLTSVAMHNATVGQSFTTVSPKSNLTIVMLQAEVGFGSKHSVVPFYVPCSPFIASLAEQTPVVYSQG